MKAPAEHAGVKPLLRGLARAPSTTQRARLGAHLRDFIRWHHELGLWPTLARGAPDATAFASVYVGGVLRGCFGVDDGAPGERVARALLKAFHDTRFGGVASGEHGNAVATLGYAHSVAPVDTNAAVSVVEAGTHGLLYVDGKGRPTILLPQVARDMRASARDLLAALAKKAQVSAFDEGRLFVFETFDVTSRLAPRARSPLAAGAAFLERLVGDDGHVDFAIDARTGTRTRTGEMHHGRAAVVVRALATCGRKVAAARARGRLERDIEQALGGRAPEGWPSDPNVVAGTLALAIQAGVNVTSELIAHVERAPIAASPWHAAQVVVALSTRAPRRLYDQCVADLGAHPWAPWTALAAQTLGDRATRERCAEVLVRSVRARAPHEGGVGFRDVPEIALTALVVEALVEHRDARARRAVKSALGFLRAWQLDPRTPRGPVDLELASGGFPLSPVVDILRGDVTGHALLAMSASEKS